MTTIQKELHRATKSPIAAIGTYGAAWLAIQLLGDEQSAQLFERLTLPVSIVIAALLIKDGLTLRIMHRHYIGSREISMLSRSQDPIPEEGDTTDIWENTSPLDTGTFRVADLHDEET